ncbi:MAG: nickel pincer cofactor biosynthesis protein LarB [bacterium]|nr:nickel pincer cofactor biosynthesis protein LarB [bacterium]
MDKEKLYKLLEGVKDQSIDIDTALHSLKSLPYDDLGFANIDNHRALRQGFPEVIFCQGKTLEHIRGIVERLSAQHTHIIGTRAGKEVHENLKEVRDDVEYSEIARFIRVGKVPLPVNNKKILVITAGTSDIPVAEEAALTAESMSNKVERLFDVGVAGIHRLFGRMETLHEASVIIVAAGMDGALPSILGGLVDVPVIAVPTSVGYGASFGGISALLTMLNSCAPGVVVVNIDNGFGAGYAASMINQGKEDSSKFEV